MKKHIFSKSLEFQDVMCNPYASVSVSLREMFIGIHMVALSLDCLMLSPSLAGGGVRLTPEGLSPTVRNPEGSSQA